MGMGNAKKMSYQVSLDGSFPQESSATSHFFNQVSKILDIIQFYSNYLQNELL